MSFDFKTATPDTSFPANGFLMGADSQSASDPSLYSHTAYLNYILSLANTWTATQTITPAANTNALAVTGYSLTGSNSQSLIDLAGTWNTSAGPTAIKLNITNTASSSSTAKIIDLQVGGVTSFSVGVHTGPLFQRASNTWSFCNSNTSFPTIDMGTSLGIRLGSAMYVGWNSATYNDSGSVDLTLYRDAANILAQRNGTTAQTHRMYRTFTDSSNYQRLTRTWNTSTALIMNEGAGTGTDGNIAFNDAALATNATVGYIMIPSCAGAPTGVPADIPTGQVALHFDTTNNKLYVYDGGWLSTAALT